MNQSRTTYQTDYTPFDWLQNNFISDMNEFCSPDNVDECLKYISQEFCALGYPSIYSNSSDCPFAVNCDIVKFLNASFELLRSYNRHTQIKEDLEDRNQRLTTDLNVLNKKNSQLKNALEQNERKLASSLEKERQLKEKNEELLQLLKTEKEETKKLTAQMRQLKVAHQHEIRKYENDMNHVKTKLNQLLSNKNPNKKLTNINISHYLPRNTGQRGKWKTDTSATTATEEMFKSVISSYETRCNDMQKELNLFRQFLQPLLLQIVGIVSELKNDGAGSNRFSVSDEFILNEVKSGGKQLDVFEEKFKYLFSVLKDIASRKTSESKNLENQIALLKLKISEYERIQEKCSESQMIDESSKLLKSMHAEKEGELPLSVALEIKKERLKLEEEKKEFLKSLEKEKAELSSQKLAILKLAMHQKAPASSWCHSLNSLPAVSVITSRNGTSRISYPCQFKYPLSSSDETEENKCSSPQWVLPEQSCTEALTSKSDSMLITDNRSGFQSTLCSPLSPDLIFPSSDLPSWATKKSESPTIVVDEISYSETSQNISSEDFEQASEPSSEEINLLRLKSAVQDIEQRRNNISDSK